MDIELQWSREFPIKLDQRGKLIYECETISSIPNDPGLYVFGRIHGDRMIPLYIGQSKTVRSRIKTELNNLKLMKGIQGQPRGRRVLYVGRIKPKQGQKMEKVLLIAEKAFIRHALSEGIDLLQKQGTKTPVHTFVNYGRQDHLRSGFPLRMLMQR